MERVYDIDISEIDFKGNQERMRKMFKKRARKEKIKSIVVVILAFIWTMFMLFAPAVAALVC